MIRQKMHDAKLNAPVTNVPKETRRFLATLFFEKQEKPMKLEELDTRLNDATRMLKILQVCYNEHHVDERNTKIFEIAMAQLRVIQTTPEKLLSQSKEAFNYDLQNILGQLILDLEKTQKILERDAEWISQTRYSLQELTKELEKIDATLKNSVCTDSQQLTKLAEQLKAAFSIVKSFIRNSMSYVILEGSTKLRRIDNADAIDLERKTDALLRSTVEEYNKGIDEFGRALLEHRMFKRCNSCIIRRYAKFVSKDWVQLRALIMRINKRFPSVSKVTKKIMDEIEEKCDGILNLAKDYAINLRKSQAIVALYRDNAKTIEQINDLILQVNKTIEKTKLAIKSLCRNAERIYEMKNGFSTEEVNGDIRNLAVKIQIIEQTSTLRQQYCELFSRIRILITELNTAFEEIETHNAQLQENLRKILAYTGKMQTASESLLPGTGRLGDALEVLHAVTPVKKDPNEMLALQWPQPNQLDLLERITHAKGTAGQRRLVSEAANFYSMQRRLVSNGIAYNEEAILMKLRALEAKRKELDLEENERGLVRRLKLLLPENRELMTLLTVYEAALDNPSSLDKTLKTRAVESMLATPEQAGIEKTGKISHIEFVEKAMEAIKGRLYLLPGLIRTNGHNFDDHAIKHAGWISRENTTSELELKKDEIQLWEQLRRGNGEYSVNSLGIRGHELEIPREHYYQVAIRLIEAGIPYIALYRYENMDGRVVPNLFFLRELSSSGFPGTVLYSAFNFSLNGNNLTWRTTYLSEAEQFLNKTKLSLITPLPRHVLQNYE